MNKKLIFFIILVCIIGGFYFFSSKKPFKLPEYCAFCNSDVLARQTFYEDELVVALYTHKPISPGHCLIIPKRHVERFEMLSDDEMTHMGQVIQKVHQAVSQVFHTSSYLLLQKNGVDAGQTVPHVHVHYIPRDEGQGSLLKFFFQMGVANVKKPLPSAEMQEIVSKMKESMS